jgi:hypothetical protein
MVAFRPGRKKSAANSIARVGLLISGPQVRALYHPPLFYNIINRLICLAVRTQGNANILCAKYMRHLDGDLPQCY